MKQSVTPVAAVLLSWPRNNEVCHSTLISRQFSHVCTLYRENRRRCGSPGILYCLSLGAADNMVDDQERQHDSTPFLLRSRRSACLGDVDA